MKNTSTRVTVTTEVKLDIAKTWEIWTSPHHILHWNAAHESWTTTEADNNLVKGGKFCYRMEARDGSGGFDFSGTYDEIKPHELIKLSLDDSRLVIVQFDRKGDNTQITETFETESANSVELQRNGWQAILDNFKNYSESSVNKDVLSFSINIKRPPLQVFETMLSDLSYRKWTSVFNPTSHFRGSWAKGSKIHFIGVDSEGNEAGMASCIKENKPGRFLSIEHLGSVKDGQEILEGNEAEAWRGSLENYKFETLAGGTKVSVTLDSLKEYSTYFRLKWPEALEQLKKCCEEMR